MMRKLLVFGLGFMSIFSFGQNLIIENFDALGSPITLPVGWTITNQSNPIGTTSWLAGGGGTAFAGLNGGQNGYIGANVSNTTGVGIVSNWLISPVLTLKNGDVVSFYTRAAGGAIYADNLEMRISTAGASSVDPSGPNGFGDYTTLAVTVNTVFPSAAGYPLTWTQYSYTVSGLSALTDCRIAFRYTVSPSGGPNGSNSNFIGIDAFSVDRTLGTGEFFVQNFKVYPNPTVNELNISSNDGFSIEGAVVLDLHGRIVKNVKGSGLSEMEINVSDLNSGMYFIDVLTDQGKATSKFMKK